MMESVVAGVSQVCVSLTLKLAYVGSNLGQVSGYVLYCVSIISGSGLWVLAHGVRIRPSSAFTSPRVAGLWGILSR
jgi:hypothetical protein